MKRTHSIRAGGPAGFTLIELMVTIAIAAILATIGTSSYISQARKSRRTEARTALLDLAAREERYFSTNSTYTTAPINLGYAGTFPMAIGNSYYQINVATPTATSFTATATPINSQASDTQCGTFTVDNTGQQTASGTIGTAGCWN